MKTYTPPPITGYRSLTQTEVDRMNAIKALGDNHIKPMVDEVQQAAKQALDGTGPESARWAAVANTHFQQGLMALLRAVAKPTNY